MVTDQIRVDLNVKIDVETLTKMPPAQCKAILEGIGMVLAAGKSDEPLTEAQSREG